MHKGSLITRTAAAVAFVLALFVSVRGQSGGTSIQVPAGGDLQGAINRARPGDTIVLEAGATYVGNFVLPARSNDEAFITIRSSAQDATLPGATARIGPGDAPRLPKLRSPNNQPALSTAEVFNNGFWFPVHSMTEPRVFQTATALPGGSVLAAGGGPTLRGKPSVEAARTPEEMRLECDRCHRGWIGHR